MQLQNYGLHFMAKGEAIENVSTQGMEISLLASYDGTEIIHHRLFPGTRWAIGPSEGWNGLEFMYILAGSMSCLVEDHSFTMQTGDTLGAIKLTKDGVFQANVEVEFLYITSQPVFHYYSDAVQKMKDLSIQVEEKDGYTAEHCNRIMHLSMSVGERMKLLPNELYHLNLGSFLHDIGKLNVPDSILNKPGKLTPEEWEVMRMHPTYGKEILEKSALPYLRSAAIIVEQHHERYNGTGYPNGLKEDEISIAAAIVAVVDSFDAMTTDRVYRKGLSVEEAIIEIKNGKSSLYHPEVVEHFLSILDEEKEKEV